MTGRDEQATPESESGRAARMSGGGQQAGRETIADRDRTGSAEKDQPDPEAIEAPEPEPGTPLDEATSTVTNTGPSA